MGHEHFLPLGDPLTNLKLKEIEIYINFDIIGDAVSKSDDK